MRGGQRNNRHGTDVISAQPFDELGKACFLVQIVDQVRLLVLPHPPRRSVLEGHFTAGALLDGDAAFENVQAHDVLRGVVKNQGEEVEINDGMKTRGKIMEQRGEIALLRDGLAHFEQGFKLAPGVLPRGGLRHFRRRDCAFRHNRQHTTKDNFQKMLTVSVSALQRTAGLLLARDLPPVEQWAESQVSLGWRATQPRIQAWNSDRSWGRLGAGRRPGPPE